MREIRQALYNPDELAWEVIEELTNLIKAEDGWTTVLQGQFELDRTLFESVASGDDSNATRDNWLGAEQYWKDMASDYEIEVYDDGEGGFTYIGKSWEVSDVYYGSDNEEEA